MQQRAMPTGTPEQNDNKKESVQRDFVVEYIRYSGFLLRQKKQNPFFFNRRRRRRRLKHIPKISL